MIKFDYVNRRSLILTPNRPYTTTVVQHGTFYPQYLTYGTLKQFPQKQIPFKKPPIFGAFKSGDPAHKGYNKTIGKNWPYYEDPEVDSVMYRPSRTFNSGESKPAWKDPTHGISTPIKSIHDNYRNSGKEDSNQFLRSSVKFGQGLYVNQLVMASRKKQ